jgi:hypothetical protein
LRRLHDVLIDAEYMANFPLVDGRR